MKSMKISTRDPRVWMDEFIATVSIGDVIGGYVPLYVNGAKKRGEYIGLCPFLKEKTPSFTVASRKGFYHCFGCGAHGSVLDFLMCHLELNTANAMKLLAEMYGVGIPWWYFRKLRKIRSGEVQLSRHNYKMLRKEKIKKGGER